MKVVIATIIGAVCAMAIQVSAVFAEDACPDPWAKVQGTYKCEGPCNYTAAVCDLPFYATNYKRWRFMNGQGGSATGVLEVKGASSIAFATTPAWNFTTANTADCGATIQFEGNPKGVTWRRIDESTRMCGGRSSKKMK